MQPQKIPLKSTYLLQNNIEEKQEVEKAITGMVDMGDLKDEQLKEVKRLLIKEGLTIEYVIKHYKELSGAIPTKVRASDVLKALERIERLWGLDSGDEQPQIRAITQTRTPNEITTTLIEVTGRTQDYIRKLTERQTP